MYHQRSHKNFRTIEKIGMIPDSWTLATVGDCFEIFPTANYSREQLLQKGDIAYVHYGDIHTKFDAVLDLSLEELPFISESMASRFTKVNDGDLIIADASEDYEGVAKTVEIKNTSDKRVISGLHTIHLRPKKKTLILSGLCTYIFQSAFVRSQLLRSATGIKVYSISKSELKRVLLPIPSMEEQRTMLKVLQLIDDAILEIKKAIASVERLKKASMQALLSGKLSLPVKKRSKNQLIDTKIGTFPRHWEFLRVSDIATKVTDGEHATPARVEKGHMLLSARNIKNGYIDYSQLDYVPDHELERIQRRCKPEEGDLFISCSGTIGNVCLVPAGLNCGLVRSVALVKLKQERIEPEFAELLFQSSFMFKQMLVSVSSSVQGNLFQGAIKKMRIPLPPKSERQEILKEIEFVNNVINAKVNKLSSLRKIRKAMVQNVLSGQLILNSKETDQLVFK